jgi:hypothetical protein
MTVIELGEAARSERQSPGSSPRERKLLAVALLTAPNYLVCHRGDDTVEVTAVR